MNAVTAATPTAVIPSQATAAAWPDGQASAATARVHLAAGAPTALCPAAVRTVVPALLRMGAASVPLASEDPCARESAPLASMDTAVPSLAHCVCTVADLATTSAASVSASQGSLEPCATKCVLEDTLGRTVPSSARVPTMGPAAPSTAPASASPDGLARTAPRHAHQGSGALPASTPAAATTGRAAALRTGPAAAPQAGLDSSAHSVAQQHFLGRTAGVCASVRMAPAVTTSVASAPAAQASLDAIVNSDVPQEPLAMDVSSCVSA